MLKSGSYYRVEIEPSDVAYVLELMELMSEVPNFYGDTTGTLRQSVHDSLSQPGEPALMQYDGLLYLLDVLGDSPDAQDQRITAVLDAAADRRAYLVV